MAKRKKQTDEIELSPGAFWARELEESKKSFKKWIERGRKVIRRYRDERSATETLERKFNILWANIQVLIPAHYGRKPKPEVSRRYKDQDPAGRAAALMLERCLEYEVDEYTDFDSALRGAVEDKLLPGRGTAWVRFEQNQAAAGEEVGEAGEEAPASGDLVSEDIDATVPTPQFETSPCDYVHWEDFLHNPARNWDEVWWVARRAYLTRDEGVKRFGEVFRNVPIGDEKEREKSSELPKDALKKKAAVWEVWDKSERKVAWIAENYDHLLDEKPDPLQLDGFFPCPKPLFATTTTGSLIPVPDFVEYQDQADEIDILTQRISMLVKALRVTGVYNAEFSAIQRVLNEGIDNQMIPVDSWAAFAEKGGMKGAMEFVPIESILAVLQGLYQARDLAKQGIYEIMGISDIIRGATNPQETLGAQQLKASYGSLRLRESQGMTAVFATDLLRKKAEIISRFYSDQTIVMMSGVQNTLDANLIPQALELIRSNILDFRINVEADTLAQLDEAREKQDRVEFLTAVGAFLEKSLPAIQAYPPVAKLLGELLLFGVRGFKVGGVVESVFEEAMSRVSDTQQPIPPEVQQMQAALAEKEQELAERERNLEAQQIDQAKKEYSIAERDLGSKLREVQATAGEQNAKVRMESADKEVEVSRVVSEALANISAVQTDAVDRQTQALSQLILALNEALTAPKRTRLIRGADGRAQASVSEIVPSGPLQ